MKLLKTLTLTLSALTLTACVSTQPPVVTVESNEVYEFSDEKSFALNVAHMTRKTAGLSDRVRAEDAQFKANKALVGAEYALAFLTNGLGDLAGSMVAQSSADRKFNWKPMLVFLADIDENNVDASVVKVVEKELQATFDNLEGGEFLGLVRLSSDTFINNFVYYYGGEVCENSDATKVSYPKLVKSNMYLNLSPSYDGACETGLNIEVMGEVLFNGEEKSVITVQVINGFSNVDKVLKSTSGFAVVPQSYGAGRYGTKRYMYKSPFVVHDDKLHFFTKDNFSVPIK